jgi:hypothetical protein
MEATGLIESWSANPSQLGPIYPFNGTEIGWVVLVVCFCTCWVVWQIRSERAEHEATARSVRESSES